MFNENSISDLRKCATHVQVHHVMLVVAMRTIGSTDCSIISVAVESISQHVDRQLYFHFLKIVILNSIPVALDPSVRTRWTSLFSWKKCQFLRPFSPCIVVLAHRWVEKSNFSDHIIAEKIFIFHSPVLVKSFPGKNREATVPKYKKTMVFEKLKKLVASKGYHI